MKIDSGIEIVNFCTVRIWIFSLLVFVFCAAQAETNSGATVLEAARSYKNGGTYNWSGSGTPEAIIFKGTTILAAGKGTYCSGFTFAVAMRAAEKRGLLKTKTPEQIRIFQREWYGASGDKQVSEIQAGIAMKHLGIGENVPAEKAQPGDFVQFWRTSKSGHSAVFLGWIEENGAKIGFKYRSTQKSTDGIGDNSEFFSDAGKPEGKVIRARTYFARLR
jgi:cell wall-associated NlpC family hydrolase